MVIYTYDFAFSANFSECFCTVFFVILNVKYFFGENTTNFIKLSKTYFQHKLCEILKASWTCIRRRRNTITSSIIEYSGSCTFVV